MVNLVRKIVFLFLLFLPLALLAEPIDETEARQRAQAFLQERSATMSASPMKMVVKGRRGQSRRAASVPVEAKDTAAVCDYFVFNVGADKGFVIVSGDDAYPAILGYADEGSISLENMPDGLRFLLDSYAAEIKTCEADNLPETNRAGMIRAFISPLVTTRWDQGSPYNKYCPTIDDKLTVTGCVATAMAQVMYYHKYPQGDCEAIPGYTTRTNKIEVKGLLATTFDWNNMTATYASGATGAAANAVAKLMQYCGAALEMNYGLSSTGGSSAYNASMADDLKTYFGYQSTYVQRHHYSYQEWVNLIYGELADSRPVVLGGQSTGGGHSFVCDGYDTGDYFHINWGWGGSSDGYFRLSLLNPYEQGIGGSSTLDGFGFAQDAVIGIKSNNGSKAPTCLSLEKLQFDATGSVATQVINRANASDAFTNIPLYITICSYKHGTHSFDYAVQLTDADGLMLSTPYESLNQSMSFNSDVIVPDISISTPVGLDNGTYYIKVVSRVKGSYVWQDCYDGLQQRIKAVVSGNTLTLTAPIVRGSSNIPSAATIVVSGDKIKGHEQTVTASITGGATDYHGDVVLRVNGTSVMGKTLDIPAGQTVDASFAFTPSTAGENTLTLYTAKSGGTQIGSAKSVTITDSDASDTLTIKVSPSYANLINNKFYGNAVRVTATVTNPSSVNSYASKLNCSLREYDSAEGGDYNNATVKSQNITIEKNGTTDVVFEYTGLKAGKFYCLRFTYTQGYIDEEDGKSKKRTKEALMTDRYEMGQGYLLYNANGTFSIQPASETVNCGSALCVDLTSFDTSTDTNVTPSTNSNCLYLLDSEAVVPAALSSCNVVKGSVAANLSLTDGSDFFTPINFTATYASYTRTFTVAASGTKGWNTLLLPFTPSVIKVDDGSVDGKTVDWFHSSSDTGKHFWLRAFTDDGEGTVNFDYASTLAANTPYIIAVPGNNWGEEWEITGKPMTFSATDVQIEKTASTVASVSGNHYQFTGSTVGSSIKDVYLLNDAGSRFVKKTVSTPVSAFRAWFEPISITSLSLASLAIGSPEVSGIELPSVSNSDRNPSESVWYTLSGMKLKGQPTAPGIYIYKGKAIVIK